VWLVQGKITSDEEDKDEDEITDADKKEEVR
jgi:hypothetical protein